MATTSICQVSDLIVAISSNSTDEKTILRIIICDSNVTVSVPVRYAPVIPDMISGKIVCTFPSEGTAPLPVSDT